MAADQSDHYAVLGLDRRCTPAQIRAAYRLLVKRHHPDLNPDCADALVRAQELNCAHETLSDPARRRDYDRELDQTASDSGPSRRSGKIEKNIAHDVHMRIGELLCGTTMEVEIKDPADFETEEIYTLVVPPETAPGSRFRIARSRPEGGFVLVRVRALPSHQFKVRGSDLRCDLRIDHRLAEKGGSHFLTSATGGNLRVEIPAQVSRGEVLKVKGEGLPKPRGGRGDLLVRVTYRVPVTIRRAETRSNRR